MNGPRVAIVGSGPVGLEAALAAAERGLPFTLYEAGDRPAANVRRWGHVRLFSPWSLNVSPRMRRHLERAGRVLPDGDDCPTGHEMADRVLDPVAALPAVADRLRLGTRVASVGREGMLKSDAIGSEERGGPPFRLLVEDAGGGERVAKADVVLDCTGTYAHPNSTGDGGIPAPGERALGSEVCRRIPDVETEADVWGGRTTLLVGAGHSAQTAVRDLADLATRWEGTRIVWSVREESPDWTPVPDDPLPERVRLMETATALANGRSVAVELRAGTVVERMARDGERYLVALRHGSGEIEDVAVDRILSLTGYVGNHRIYRQLQVHECWATSGPMKLAASLLATDSGDCLTQESGGVDLLRNPEPGFFILGAKSYGRNSAFLMKTGWAQVEEVFGTLA